MSDPAPAGHVNSASRESPWSAIIAYGFLWLGFFGLIGVISWWWCRPPGFVAEATLLVFNRLPAPPGGVIRRQLFDDYMPAQATLLTSPAILGQAIKKRELTNLKSLEDANDAVETLRAMVWVVRDGPGPSNVMRLRCRGPVAGDCENILTAITESYQDYLDVTYRNVSLETIELIAKARETVAKDLKVAEEKYMAFRSLDPFRFRGHINSSAERLKRLEQRLADVTVNRIEIMAELAPAVLSPESPRVTIRAREWGTKAGYDALPEGVRKSTTFTTAYIEHLNERLEQQKAIEVALNRAIKEAIQHAKEIQAHETQDQRLRADVARCQSLWEATVKRLEEINILRDSVGFEVRVLAPPKVVKSR